MVKNPPANAGDVRDVGLILGLERFPGGGHGSPLQYSCLESHMDRGAWKATVHRASKSQTQVKRLNTHTLLNIWGCPELDKHMRKGAPRRAKFKLKSRAHVDGECFIVLHNFSDPYGPVSGYCSMPWRNHLCKSMN